MTASSMCGARSRVFEACRRCFASLFTDRAIVYRNENGFDHMKVALSVAVMKMVRADRAASGVIFTLDTETGFRDVVLVTGSYGLGENIVQGRVDPDEFYVHKPSLRAGYRAVLRHTLGEKQVRMTFASEKSGANTRNRKVPHAERIRYCISDAEVLTLAEHALLIEEHYSAVNGRPTPDGYRMGQGRRGRQALYRPGQTRNRGVPARRRKPSDLCSQGQGRRSWSRAGPSERRSPAVMSVSSRTTRIFKNFQPGEILVADTTTPDWEPVMKRAAGIVTNRGGRTCHAAIVAREMGIPAVVGTADAIAKLKTGDVITVCCAEGDIGHVYKGALAFDVSDVQAEGHSPAPYPDHGQSRRSGFGVPDRHAAQ